MEEIVLQYNFFFFCGSRSILKKNLHELGRNSLGSVDGPAQIEGFTKNFLKKNPQKRPYFGKNKEKILSFSRKVPIFSVETATLSRKMLNRIAYLKQNSKLTLINFCTFF